MRLAGELDFSYAGIDELIDAGEIFRRSTTGEREL